MMPAITACNSQPVSLSGVSTVDYPTLASGPNLIGQTANSVYAPGVGGEARVEVISSVFRSPQTGTLDFAFQLLSWSPDPPWSPPPHFAVRWVDLPDLKITYADFITDYYPTAVPPATFTWGATNYEFRFTFNPSPPANSATRIFFVSTNATHWAENQGALATFFHNPGGPQYPDELILLSPTGLKFSKGR